jgi:hypothetical protein
MAIESRAGMSAAVVDETGGHRVVEDLAVKAVVVTT